MRFFQGDTTATVNARAADAQLKAKAERAIAAKHAAAAQLTLRAVGPIAREAGIAPGSPEWGQLLNESARPDTPVMIYQVQEQPQHPGALPVIRTVVDFDGGPPPEGTVRSDKLTSIVAAHQKSAALARQEG